MKVDTMRRIDFFIGVPLCFLSTLVNYILSLFCRKARNLPHNALFLELSEMGSAILADPAMRALQRETGCDIYFAIFKKNKPSLDLLKTVPQENIYTICENSMPAFVTDTLKFFIWTRSKHIDTIIDLELFSRFTALLNGFSGAQSRVGFHAFYNEGLYRGDFLTHKVAYNHHIHIAKNFLALIHVLIADKEEIPYSKTLIYDQDIALNKVMVTAEERKILRIKIAACFGGFDEHHHRLILINPNASELLIQRCWPQHHYIQFIKMILAKCPRALILITGDQREQEEAQILKDQVQDERCVNFAGEVTFAQLPHLYSICEFMVTNDSGPAHFAAITYMPTFVLFGPETPALYGSLRMTTPIYAGLACSPCVSAANHRKTACKDNVCLQVIEPYLEKINAEI